MNAAIKSALEALRQEFVRASYIYRPLYHQLLFVDAGIHTMTCESWIAFAAANDAPAAGEWQSWHGPVEGRDYDWFGRFSGDPTGLAEFKQLAESLHLVVRQIDSHPEAPDGGYEQILDLLHRVAGNWPTALLRSKESLWAVPENYLDDLTLLEIDEKTATDERGVSYAIHPYVETINNNLFIAVASLIGMVIDDDKTFFVSEGHWTEPSYPTLRPVEEKDDTVAEAVVPEAELTQTQSDYVFAFDSYRDKWHIRYRWGDDPGEIEEDWLAGNKDFEYVAYMLDHPNEWIRCVTILPPPVAKTRRSVVSQDQVEPEEANKRRRPMRDKGVEEEKQTYRNLIEQLTNQIKEAEEDDDTDQVRKLKHDLQIVNKSYNDLYDKFGNPRNKLTREDYRHANRVRNGIERCRTKHLKGPLPHFNEYLEKIEVNQGSCMYLANPPLPWKIEMPNQQ